jgi:hypothetical protein
LIIAYGRYPFNFKLLIGAVGSLLDNFLPSAVKTKGKCIKAGGFLSSTLYRYKCFEVLVNHYTPLIT